MICFILVSGLSCGHKTTLELDYGKSKDQQSTITLQPTKLEFSLPDEKLTPETLNLMVGLNTQMLNTAVGLHTQDVNLKQYETRIEHELKAQKNQYDFWKSVFNTVALCVTILVSLAVIAVSWFKCFFRTPHLL